MARPNLHTCVLFLDINECRNSPCQNGGTCIDGVNGYFCICSGYYTGIHCSLRIGMTYDVDSLLCRICDDTAGLRSFHWKSTLCVDCNIKLGTERYSEGVRFCHISMLEQTFYCVGQTAGDQKKCPEFDFVYLSC